MLGVVLCVFVWRMYEFLYQSTSQTVLCFTALSRLPHIRQELKCLRDNSSQIRNPRSQTTSSEIIWKILLSEFHPENFFHQPTGKFRESNSRFEECYNLFHHLPLESPFLNCSTGGPSESRLSSGWASRACLFWVAPHAQKKHVHSSFMRHQLHVFQKWFILYIYVVILGCCSLFIFINKKECHYISHISQAFGRKIHPSCLQVMKGFCPHLLLKPKSALGWLDDSTLTAVRSPLRHQLMPRDFHLLKS